MRRCLGDSYGIMEDVFFCRKTHLRNVCKDGELEVLVDFQWLNTRYIYIFLLDESGTGMKGKNSCGSVV